MQTRMRTVSIRRAAIILSAGLLWNVSAFNPPNRGLWRKKKRTNPTCADTTPTEFSSSSKTVDALQAKAALIASSFVPGNFDPWLTNCHVQTIGGFFVRDICPYVPVSNTAAATTFARALFRRFTNSSSSETKNLDFWDTRERIDSPDGDWYHVDSKLCSTDSAVAALAPTVILLHGLESNSRSSLSTEMARSYLSRGMNCVCVNFRGCSGHPNDRLGGYHLGFTDDLKHYLDILEKKQQQQPSGNPRLYLAGFSLGANVVLKCLGELGETALTQYNVHGAAVSCAPLDQEANSDILAKAGINRFIYTNNLLKSLKGRAVDQLERFFDGDETKATFNYQRAMAAETITDFDENFIAPIYGFDSAADYYQKTSSVNFLNEVAVPTMILNAKDDPFLCPTVWPTEKSREHGGRAPLKMVRTEHGGHLGFCWQRVAETETTLLQTGQGTELVSPPPSWASVEQARFLAHVHEHPATEELLLRQ